MRAKVSDPVGPFWRRAIVPALAILIMAASVVLPVEDVTAKGVLFFLGAAIFFAGPLGLARLGTRDATLKLGDGFIDVEGAGAANQRIRTRDVTAASTARTRKGIALALARRARDEHPIILDLESDDDARRVRDALGIGHFGFGSLSWRTAPSFFVSATVMARVAAAASMLSLIAGMSEPGFFVLGSLGAFFMTPIALVLMTLGLFPRRRQSPSVSLLAEGLAIGRYGRDVHHLEPYANIADVKSIPTGIRIKRHVGDALDVDAPEATLARSRMSMVEREHLVAQISSAAQRAQGAGPPPPTLPARVSDLAKRAERGRSWLARLDATAQLLASGSGYRGCGFEEADLWATLEDHDAPADIRAAAARVLVRVAKEDVKPRVASVLARVHDDGARKRIRIATDDDIDAAGEELDRLDDREHVA